MKKLLLMAACMAAVLAPDAHAQAFIGVAGGATKWPDDICIALGSCDRHPGTWLVRGGFMFLPYIGIEARYVDLGKTSSTRTDTFNGGSVSTSLQRHYLSKGPALGAMAAFPIAERFGVTAVAGAARLKTRVDVPDTILTQPGGTVTGLGEHAEHTYTNAYYGIGADYHLTANMSVGVEATRYRVQFVGTDNVDTLTASFTLYFR